MNARMRRTLVVAATTLLALLGIPGAADARCVTVGFDGMSHTQCDLP